MRNPILIKALAQYARHAAMLDDGTHVYLSTGCLHGDHGHCRSSVAASGDDKEPGTCKFCPARCVCECHEWNGGSGAETD